MRVKFNEGQELIRADLNKLQQARQREFYDRVLYEMLQRSGNAFAEGSCLVSRVDANTLRIAAGLGFQTDLTQVSPEPVRRPIYVAANVDMDITAAHGSLNRIDIVSIKAAVEVTDTESRRYKATVEAVPTNQSFDIEEDWEADIVITAGTPDASPVAPATPAGYIRIASVLVTAVTGIAAGGDVTDERTYLAFGPNAKIDTSLFTTVGTTAPDTPLKTVLFELDQAIVPTTEMQEIPSGTVNGINVTFTLSDTPKTDSALKLYQDGLMLRQGTDYTVSGVTITMTTAPELGQELYANYIA
jgi:hypothetical protein